MKMHRKQATEALVFCYLASLSMANSVNSYAVVTKIQHAFSIATYLYVYIPHHTTTVLRPFSGTTRVSRCQKKTSGLYGAREE